MPGQGLHNPFLPRHRLRRELQHLRIRRKLTQRSVADRLYWSESKVLRIESGKVTVSVSDLQAMLDLYGVTESEQVDVLVTMARASRKHAWWSEYRDILKPGTVKLLSYQGAATAIRAYRVFLMPGLLQTERYARALTVGLDDQNPGVADRLIEAHLVGQQRFHGPGRPELTVILHEAGLRETIGGPEVMIEQLTALKQFAEEPGMTIRILPAGQGLHPGLRGSFVLYELGPVDQEAPVVLADNAGDGLLMDDPGETRPFISRFRHLEQLARPANETGALVDEVVESLS